MGKHRDWKKKLINKVGAKRAKRRLITNGNIMQ